MITYLKLYNFFLFKLILVLVICLLIFTLFKIFIICVAAVPDNVITFGVERHMSVVCKDKQGNIVSLGYLTSHKKGTFINSVQVKDYQRNSAERRKELLDLIEIIFNENAEGIKDNAKRIMAEIDFIK